MKRFYILTLVIALAVFMLFVSMVVPLLTTRSDFSILNPGWNGCSELGSRYYEGGSLVPNYELAGTGEEITISQVDLSRQDLEPGGLAVVILRPVEDFTEAELQHLSVFLQNGGTIFLADDFGNGNQLLKGLGCKSRFTREPFVSLSFNKAPEFSVVTDIDPPFNDSVRSILLNHPSTILPGENATVYARTTLGWLDSDGDFIREEDEASGVFPILAVESLGRGRMVLLSDPSIMINSMLARANNSRFVTNLFQFTITPGGSVLFDESHNGGGDTLSSAGSLMADLPPVFTGVILLGFLSVSVFLSLDISPEWAAGMARMPLAVRVKGNVLRAIERFTPGPEPAGAQGDVLEAVAARHPEWDRGLLERLLDATGAE